MRQNSEGDTQPFRKENLIFQTTGFHSAEPDDSKDCISSDSKEVRDSESIETISNAFELDRSCSSTFNSMIQDSEVRVCRHAAALGLAHEHN